ncbi:DUF3991 domain-containing protein [Sinanaerobacter sp. ZZT-01]|uniref:DUF3991 domain-containing protein n=1 Tax=Sinanaerobacter sp. ZZT-01 TaxID=3111540 RepID=UPI002D7906B7|nr:DUF3991 domain-containing protein [Sinanaerobacter sp. ZZT-01]WRR94248.1 DUF3991 domain-containing protein [Sinanaerobacter sp. ZZT-01]
MAVYTKEDYELARGVHALDYLRATGHVLEKSGKDWQLKEHDSLKISGDGKWFWHSRNTGGQSPISLVHELEGISKLDAIKKLAEFAGGTSVTSEITASVQREMKKVEFQLPEKNDTTKRAYAYLTKTRGLDADIVKVCMKQGLIYESKKYNNAVFVGQADDLGHVKHASLRGTYTNAAKPFKGDVTGSDKSYSFALPGRNDILIVCESAIDALSQATLTKMAGGDWTEDHRLALGGMSDSSLERYLSKHPEIKTLVLALDNDKDAVDKDGNPDNHGQKRAEKLAQVYKEKGYTVLNSVTKEKDLNAELQARRGISSELPENKKVKEQKAKRTLPKEGSSAEKNEIAGIDIQQSNLKMDELWSKLEDGVRAVYSSDNYINYLKFAAKFYHYSIANCLLIAMQMPNATRVAGFQAWKKKFSRTVKKGESGLQILAPVTYNKKEAIEVVNKETGEITIENQVVQKKYYKPVYVFDVSQTEGRELPQLTSELKGNVAQYELMMKAIQAVSKYPIAFEQMQDGKKGYFSPKQKRIALRNGMSEAQTLKTAIHELAHSRLHADNSGKLDDQSKTMREIQAESVAFMVCEQLGLDTSDYSFPYIASYENQELNELKESLRTIQQGTKSMLAELEAAMEQQLEKEKSVAEETKDSSELLEEETLLKLSEIEKNPKSKSEYVMQLFQEGYRKDPVETMKIFGYPVEESTLNTAILYKDPLIQEAVAKPTSLKSCVGVIQKQIDAGNKVKGKVKVQINFSESNLPKGEFYSLMAANKVFGQYEARVRKERKIDPNRGYDKTEFALYIEDNGQWQYGISRYDIGDGYADNLLDFIQKSMYPDIVKKCEKDLLTQMKRFENQKTKSTKEDKQHD